MKTSYSDYDILIEKFIIKITIQISVFGITKFLMTYVTYDMFKNIHKCF